MEASTGPDWKKWLFRWPSYIVLCVLLYWSWPVIFHIWCFLTSDGFIMWGFWKVCRMFLWMLNKVLWATFPNLLPPILTYICICLLSDNRILRFIAGIGGIYLFYTFSGEIAFSLSGGMNLIKLVFQIYFLLILVIPDILMNVVNASACVIGSIMIYLFPSLPGFLDDLSAICVLITMVFVYMNSLAIGIKQVTDWILNRNVFKGGKH